MSSRILVGDVRDRLRELSDGSVHCVVTSPPYYGLRDYGVPGQIGLEPTLIDYLDTMVSVFREVRRVLRDDGSVWLNIGDSYAGSGPSGAGYQSETTRRRAELKQDGSFRISSRLAAGDPGYGHKKPHVIPNGLKPKDLMLVPERLALALQDDGWWVRSRIIWAKKACMPESVTDRPTNAHEHVWLLTKSARYFYDAEAVREPYAEDSEARNGRFKSVGSVPDRKDSGGFAGLKEGATGANQRNVWHLGPEPFPDAHFATFPTEIPRRCIKAGCPEGGTVLDPFLGSGTTLMVADQLGRHGIGIELNPEYARMAERRITGDAPMFAEVDVA